LGFWFSSSLSPSVPLLTRLYVAHIAIIPSMIAALVVVHAALIKRHGIAPLPITADSGGVDEPTGKFARHGRRLGAFALILLGGLAILAVLFPPALGSTPVEGIEVTKPLWMFWWLYTLENWVGLNGIIYGTVGLFTLLAVIPFIDRNRQRSWRRRPIAMTALVVVLVVLVWLSLVTGLGSPAQHLA
ncbi:MAG: cytochrome b N-terminal domain-containing protein, partial [Acidimicrobiales bacterium]